MSEEKKLSFDTKSVGSFVKSLLCLQMLAPDILPMSFQPGRKDAKLCVVTGENATGKSFFRRIVASALKREGVEAIPISMEFRSGGGIGRAFVFGDESWNATGALTANSVIGAISTSRSRTERHSIIWDEPDIGLSDNYAAGVGIEMFDFLSDPPPHLFGVFVMTHRRCLLEQLLPLKPHHVRFGDEKTLPEYMAEKLEPKRLSELRDRSLQLFRKITKELKT